MAISFRVSVVRFSCCDGGMKHFHKMHILDIGRNICTAGSNVFVLVFSDIHQPLKALCHGMSGGLAHLSCKFVD